MNKPLCKLCRNELATLPDRESGSSRKSVCRNCHAARLKGDLERIKNPQGKRFVNPRQIAQDLREIADGLDDGSIRCLGADYQIKILDAPMIMGQWIPEMDGRKSLVLDLFYVKDEGKKV